MCACDRFPFSVLHDSFNRVFPQFVFLAHFVLASSFSVSSKPSPVSCLLFIRFHRFFRALLFALLSVGPALLFSSFSFVSLLFPPAMFYLESHLLSVVWLSSFSFPPSLFFHPRISLHGSFVVALHSPHLFPHIGPTETSPTSSGGTFLLSCLYFMPFSSFVFILFLLFASLHLFPVVSLRFSSSH